MVSNSELAKAYRTTVEVVESWTQAERDERVGRYQAAVAESTRKAEQEQRKRDSDAAAARRVAEAETLRAANAAAAAKLASGSGETAEEAALRVAREQRDAEETETARLAAEAAEKAAADALAAAAAQGTLPAFDFKATLTAAASSVLEQLVDLNGGAAYSSSAVTLGKLNKSEWLRIPRGANPPAFVAADVGTVAAVRKWDLPALVQVYALNKRAFGTHANAAKIALIRMEAMKAGWLDLATQTEVTLEDPLEAQVAYQMLADDLPALLNDVDTAKTGAYLVPLFAEHTFRTMGHHYLSSDAATYNERYMRTARACLVPQVHSYMPPADLYHTALHWVMPAVAKRAIDAIQSKEHFPEALRIRVTAAPAGTALVTTTAAVMEAMDSVNLTDSFAIYGGYNLELIRKVAGMVKANPWSFHKSAFAYRIVPATRQELDMLDQAKAVAISFAPISQAFITTYLSDADLSKAKALDKHSRINPILMRKAQRFFRDLTRRDVSTIADLFRDSKYDAEKGTVVP